MFRSGETGAGTLILFIACIGLTVGTVVAFRATTTDATNSAATVGMAAKSLVTAKGDVHMITGLRSAGALTEFTIVLAPAASTEAIALDSLLISVTTRSGTAEYVLGEVPSVNASNQSGTYVREFLQTAVAHDPRVLRQGELVSLSIPLATPVGRSESVRIRLLPRGGTATVASFTTPYAFTADRTKVYP